MQPNRRQTRVRRAKKSYRGFAFVRSFQFAEDDLLPQLYLRTQHDERAVGAHRQRKRFFAKRLLVRALTADDERHVGSTRSLRRFGVFANGFPFVMIAITSVQTSV